MCDKEGKSIENFSNKLEEVLMEKTFSKPRLIIFHDVADKTNDQAFI